MVDIRRRKEAATDDHGPDCDCVVKPIRVCLGPGRCELLDARDSCIWCMVFPAGEGAEYVDTFLAIHEQGH